MMFITSDSPTKLVSNSMNSFFRVFVILQEHCNKLKNFVKYFTLNKYKPKPQIYGRKRSIKSGIIKNCREDSSSCFRPIQ